ncbi:MAG: hypothetical protein NW226_15625 [Microscillaceae bacterium]|nr:hypothetical protein [Microscillaceae bacterium]
MNNLFYKIAEKAQAEDKLVAVYEDLENPNKFLVGFVKALNDAEIYIHMVSNAGEEDGYSLIRWERIHQITYFNRYLKRLFSLFQNSSDFSDEDHERDDAGVENWEDKNILKALVERAASLNQLIQLDFYYNDWVVGYILDFDEESILVEEISSDGDEDGFSCYRLGDIVGLTGDTNYLKKVEFYYQNRKNYY